MTRRHNGGDPDGQDIVNGQLKQLFVDDEFLTDLSRGVDPSAGEDPLAGLLLDMNKEITEDMPAAPDLSVLLPGFGEGGAADVDPGTTEFAPISTPSGDNSDESGAVVALDSRRGRRGAVKASGSGRRTSHPFLHGLVGAAAATLVIAGGGTAIYNADADSPLHGLSTTLFGNTDNPSVVELASTLEEVDSRTANGDVEGARELLEQARSMLATMDERQRNSAPRDAATPVPVTETATATVTETAIPEEPAPETVTETSVQTQIQTQTQTQTVVSTVVQPPVWTPEPTQTFQPPAPPTQQIPPVDDGGGEGEGGEGGNTDGGEVAPPQFFGN